MSPEVAGELCDRLDKSLRGSESNLSQLVKNIVAVLKKEAWKERRVRTGKIVKCESFIELITAPPLKGFGEEVIRVEALLKDDAEALTMFRAATTKMGKPSEANSHYKIMTKARQGTSRAYLLTRLKQKNQTLFDKVVAGKLSAHAAARQAGLVKTKTQLEQLLKLWKKATADERAEFFRFIRAESSECSESTGTYVPRRVEYDRIEIDPDDREREILRAELGLSDDSAED